MENTEKKIHMGQRAKTRLSNSVIYVILTIMTIIWVLPFIAITLESFRVETTMQVGYVMPKKWGFDNYITLFRDTDFLKWYWNTFLMGLIVATVQTVIVLCTAYALSRMRFKMRKPIMKMCLVLGMFPGFITVIVLYNILSDLGMTGTGAIVGLCLVYTASSGMGYYISKGFFDTIPKSLDEAARVDGATHAQVLRRVILPLSKPIVIYTVLTAFMGPWGDFMFAKYIVHNTSASMNVAVGMQTMIATSSSLAAHYTHFCAAGVLVAVPITILFMCLQRYYVEGVTGGAVKG